MNPNRNSNHKKPSTRLFPFSDNEERMMLAGNSIVVSCLYHIFHQMFIAEPPEPKPIQKSLFDL